MIEPPLRRIAHARACIAPRCSTWRRGRCHAYRVAGNTVRSTLSAPRRRPRDVPWLHGQFGLSDSPVVEGLQQSGTRAAAEFQLVEQRFQHGRSGGRRSGQQYRQHRTVQRSKQYKQHKQFQQQLKPIRHLLRHIQQQLQLIKPQPKQFKQQPSQFRQQLELIQQQLKHIQQQIIQMLTLPHKMKLSL